MQVVGDDRGNFRDANKLDRCSGEGLSERGFYGKAILRIMRSVIILTSAPIYPQNSDTLIPKTICVHPIYLWLQ